MMPIRSSLVAAFGVALFFCCAAQSVVPDDDPLLSIKGEDVGDQGTRVHYDWAVRKSRLPALPSWNPSTAEAPVSPHKAAVAATEFLRTRFPPSAHLTMDRIALVRRALEKNPIAPELWTYEIVFLCDPQPAAAEQPMLTVVVLMDGRVVVPVRKLLK
jgi:hypothetical protein